MVESPDSKRRHERIRISSSKSIWNLSEGGVFITTTNPRRLGSIVRFEFRLWPDEPPFHALGKVIRVLHQPNPKNDDPAGIAIQFTEVGDDNRVRLRAYLSEQRKLRTKPDRFAK